MCALLLLTLKGSELFGQGKNSLADQYILPKSRTNFHRMGRLRGMRARGLLREYPRDSGRFVTKFAKNYIGPTNKAENLDKLVDRNGELIRSGRNTKPLEVLI